MVGSARSMAMAKPMFSAAPAWAAAELIPTTAVEVDQRPARVAGVDGGVGLEQPLESAGPTLAVGYLYRAGRRAHDPLCDCDPEAKREADGDHRIARQQLRGLTDLDGFEIGGVDLDDGKV